MRRLGMIARADQGGIAAQDWSFARRMRPDKVLVVHTEHNTRGKSKPEIYGGLCGEMRTTRRAPRRGDAEWLCDGIDVIYTTECFYGHEVPFMAQSKGAQTVIAGNPEMTGQGEICDVMLAPTKWRLDALPGEPRVLPVPTDPELLTRMIANVPSPVTNLYHVASDAMCDRNGTDLLLEACAFINHEVRLKIRGGGMSPAIRHHGLVTVEWLGHFDGMFYNHWPTDVGALVLPRRYGGLCLADSTPIVLADGSRRTIAELMVGDDVATPGGSVAVTAVARRTVKRHIVIDVRGPSLSSSTDHLHLVAPQPDAPLREVKAQEVRVGDWMLVVQPSPEGIRSLDMMPRPRLKGLRTWAEGVVLDEGWARLVGLWLAEGHRGLYNRVGRARPQPTVCWSFGERRFAEETVGLLGERGMHATWKKVSQSTSAFGPGSVWLVRCRSLWLYEMFERLGLGHGAHGKRAPDLHSDLVPALVGGWLDGDGNLDGSAVTGWSRSTAMIRDLWRLCAKRGVLASITHRGERLDVAYRPDVEEVGSWGTRFEISAPPARAPRAPSRWRRHPDGWMVKVRAVTEVDDPLDVTAIETSSGRYIADDVLTHNCLPMQEAATLGLPIITLDVEPQRGWLPTASLVPATVERTESMRGGQFDIYRCDPRRLAGAINMMIEDPSRAAYMRERSIAWAESISWDALSGHYQDVFR